MMKKIALVVVLLAFSGVMLAQTSGMDKDNDKTEHAHKGKMAGGSGTLAGCLSGPNDEGAYVLTNAKGKKIEVGGSDDLKAHVGHQVKLTGTWAKSGADIGENEKKEAAEKNEKGEKMEHERHFKVTKIEHVAPTCTQGAASGGEHKKKSAEKKSAS
jgi:hypothetical protein